MLFGLSGDDEIDEAKKGAVRIATVQKGATVADGEGFMPLVQQTNTTQDDSETDF